MSNNNEINRFFIVQNKTIIMFIQSVMLMFNSIIDELFLLQRFLSLSSMREEKFFPLWYLEYIAIRFDWTKRERKKILRRYIYINMKIDFPYHSRTRYGLINQSQ